VKILLIEDHAPLRESLVQGLQEEGFVVESAEDGETGLWLARSSSPDAIVLDLMLPRLDGLSLLQQLRRRDTHTPVIILTARDAVEDRVEGLNLGADDYLPKPFAFDELLARLSALSRRRYDSRQPVLRIGELELDTARRRLRRHGAEIHLSPREYNLLELLVREAGRVVSREEIWSRVYEFHSEAASNVVDVYIRYLRKKLDAPRQPSLIETVRGHGYRLRSGTDTTGDIPPSDGEPA
jgi:two-component system OmpR family response regulator